jgi:hypothetical protein
LQGKGIDMILRYGNGGRLFGATFIDHNSRTVLNGSALGKEFSANALGARFTDFSTADREDLQTVSPVVTRESQHPTVQPAHDDKQPATVKGYSGDDSPVGSLLSMLTPEPDQRDDNQPMPTKRKKKKRRYGRQV